MLPSEVIWLVKALQAWIKCCSMLQDVARCCSVIQCVWSVGNIEADLTYCEIIAGDCPLLSAFLFANGADTVLNEHAHVFLDHGCNLNGLHHELNRIDAGHQPLLWLGDSGPPLIEICLRCVDSRELVTSVDHERLPCFSSINLNLIKRQNFEIKLALWNV